MPSWTEKDERQFDHVKDSALERGRSEELAEEIAGRTVNKQRRERVGRPRAGPPGRATLTAPSKTGAGTSCTTERGNSTSWGGAT